MKLALLDYGSGNLHSAARAFAQWGDEVSVVHAPEVADFAALIVPGVGAFGACMTQLQEAGGEVIIANFIDAGKPVFGICVGMQVLFSRGLEKGSWAGLDYLAGDIAKLSAPILPHMGWDTFSELSSQRPLVLKGISERDFYYVHSYGATDVTRLGDLDSYALCNYGGSTFVALANKGLITTTQFHPEKSGSAGAALIKNWLELVVTPLAEAGNK